MREQCHNLARSIEMLEQAVAMMSEPREGTLARAECLRGAGMITMLAASELLVVAGWFEADQAVKAGTLQPVNRVNQSAWAQAAPRRPRLRPKSQS